MAKMEYELETSLGSRSAAQEKEKAASKRLLRFIPVMVAILLLTAGVLLMKFYVDQVQQQLAQIHSEAAALNRNVGQVQAILGDHRNQLEQLQEKFASINSEMEAVREELALAGYSLQSTDETKKALSERIADLSKELDALKMLIVKLEEAARVY